MRQTESIEHSGCQGMQGWIDYLAIAKCLHYPEMAYVIADTAAACTWVAESQYPGGGD